MRQVIVCRDWGEAAIAWEVDGGIRESVFKDAEGNRRSEAADRDGTLCGLARIGGAALLEIARDLHGARG